MYNSSKPFRLLERSLENSLNNFNPSFKDWQSYANAPANVYQQEDKIDDQAKAHDPGRTENDEWSDLNNPNNDYDLDDWADAHNPNNDDYVDD